MRAVSQGGAKPRLWVVRVGGTNYAGTGSGWPRKVSRIASRAPIPRRRAVSITERTSAWSLAPQTERKQLVTLREDRTPAQRLLRAIVGWGSLGLEEEDEQPVLPPEQAAAELLGGHVACDWLRDHLRECEEVAPEEGLDHPGAAAACQALAMTPDANSATQQRNHLPGQHGVAAVERVLGVAQEVGKAGLVLLAPARLRPEPVGDPNTWPHAIEEALDHVLVAPWFDDEAATVGILEHPQPPVGLAHAKARLVRADHRPRQQSAADRRHLRRERRRRSLEHRRQRALAQLHPELHVQNRGQPLIGHGVTLPQMHHRRPQVLAERRSRFHPRRRHRLERRAAARA